MDSGGHKQITCIRPASSQISEMITVFVFCVDALQGNLIYLIIPGLSRNSPEFLKATGVIRTRRAKGTEIQKNVQIGSNRRNYATTPIIPFRTVA